MRNSRRPPFAFITSSVSPASLGVIVVLALLGAACGATNPDDRSTSTTTAPGQEVTTDSLADEDAAAAGFAPAEVVGGCPEGLIVEYEGTLSSGALSDSTSAFTVTAIESVGESPRGSGITVERIEQDALFRVGERVRPFASNDPVREVTYFPGVADLARSELAGGAEVMVLSSLRLVDNEGQSQGFHPGDDHPEAVGDVVEYADYVLSLRPDGSVVGLGECAYGYQAGDLRSFISVLGRDDMTPAEVLLGLLSGDEALLDALDDAENPGIVGVSGADTRSSSPRPLWTASIGNILCADDVGPTDLTERDILGGDVSWLATRGEFRMGRSENFTEGLVDADSQRYPFAVRMPGINIVDQQSGAAVGGVDLLQLDAVTARTLERFRFDEGRGIIVLSYTSYLGEPPDLPPDTTTLGTVTGGIWLSHDGRAGSLGRAEKGDCGLFRYLDQIVERIAADGPVTRTSFLPEDEVLLAEVFTAMQETATVPG